MSIAPANYSLETTATRPALEWLEQRASHRARFSSFLSDYRYWRNHGCKHPVYDFLFHYYSFSTGELLRWSPGIGVALEVSPENAAESEIVKDWPKHFIQQGKSAWIDLSSFPARRYPFLDWAICYLENTLARPPVFHCFGLHEWAMVYKTKNLQHPHTPLRVSAAEVESIVEEFPICCTHYDAFRFFSPEAAKLNRQQLRRDTVMEFDQSGCIHANMDLYKFGYKISPFIPSELLGRLFLLAREAREIDMRASPYDLSFFQMEPIRIETKAGREEYVRYQKGLVEQALPLRLQLLEFYRRMRSTLKKNLQSETGYKCLQGRQIQEALGEEPLI